ncbi:contractile injection system tape measure protein [Aequorivita lipolytica]|uniref:Uncharacterized protein n=1 Tax=Aequorivita lipolytica TaxID=153267 RepID=A0A5C6YNJ5_9FLAO|nr:contractile injection system tape measure protein [Aequorivita lipolytica]TXD68981.1 hypothetical protein ESV24_09520 [Aequorivita lipolytica]SRX53011.1 hypothetical protein AEQU2_02268 [Aequorivita lipolytica]
MEEENQILISNAGISILWPFLPKYFEHLGFVNDGQFVNDESRNRALYLLHYLAYNAINFPEEYLPFNKILVGMPIDHSVEEIEEITPYEEELSKSLLGGLIHNWSKVQDSSPEAIQETFLQRDGLITVHPEYNLLVVEKRGVDVLMESIPWNLSVIKLPWMVEAMKIEWV